MILENNNYDYILPNHSIGLTMIVEKLNVSKDGLSFDNMHFDIRGNLTGFLIVSVVVGILAITAGIVFAIYTKTM